MDGCLGIVIGLAEAPISLIFLSHAPRPRLPHAKEMNFVLLSNVRVSITSDAADAYGDVPVGQIAH